MSSECITVYNVYRPPASSNYAKPFSTFLDEFHCFLCCAATTPNEFLITGDFNIHVDDPYDYQANSFLTLLSDANLVQHVNFPTQDPVGHTLVLVIWSVDSNLNPECSCRHTAFRSLPCLFTSQHLSRSIATTTDVPSVIPILLTTLHS